MFQLKSAIFCLIVTMATAHYPAVSIALDRVWIDTDPACGTEHTADVDDCLALLQALASPELRIVGISTVHGNGTVDTAQTLTRQILAITGHDRQDLGPFRGAASPFSRRVTPASEALAAALEKGPLRIIALGPWTNLATLVKRRPDLLQNVTEIVAVAGRRPGQRFHPGRNSSITFRDFNICQNPFAALAVLKAPVHITLLPFEAAEQVLIRPNDLNVLAASGTLGRWLAARAQGWMEYWIEDLGNVGFYPFDALAIGYAARPEHFRCETLPAGFVPRRLLGVIPYAYDLVVDRNLSKPLTTVRYCNGVHAAFKAQLLRRLTADAGRSAVPRRLATAMQAPHTLP